ncbi:MAG TPA: metal ABC transporter permease [Sulfurimonas sp.]|nr:metal ABC transporter permease [Sulfurimonas sp.]
MLEIFEYDFMVNAFLAGIIIAILASVSGSFIVLRRYAMLTETLAHVALVGVAIGMVTEQNPIWVAVFVSVVSAWLIEYLRSYLGLYSDSILAIFLSGSLALAVIIVSVAGSFNASLFSYLFGSILSVTNEDLIVMLAFGSLSMAVLIGFFKEFYFIAFDEEVAQVSGLKVKLLNFVLVTIIAVIISLSIRVVGTLLIGALMVIPTISALRYRLGFSKTILLSLLFSISAVLLGMTLSYNYSLPSGATIVLVILVIFVISMVSNRK